MKGFLLVLALIVSAVAITGCDNVGNENPITPEQMDRERTKQANDRANFNPSNAPAKPGG